MDNAPLYASLECKVADRTEALEAANRRLEALNITDPLTGLANRRRFSSRCSRPSGIDPAAHSDDAGGRIRQLLRELLGSLTLHRDAQLGHDLDRERIDAASGLGPRREAEDRIAFLFGQMVRERFGHLGATRVVDSDEEDSLG
jgi:hypothetical protein